jgi:hypothetical protein
MRVILLNEVPVVCQTSRHLNDYSSYDSEESVFLGYHVVSIGKHLTKFRWIIPPSSSWPTVQSFIFKDKHNKDNANGLLAMKMKLV